MAKSASGFSSSFLIISLVALLAAAGGGYYFWKDQQPKPYELTTTQVSRGDITQAITATGDLEPLMSVDVSSTISGQILEVLVDFNTPVKTGQLLARIDPATYQSRLRQAEADLMSTEANNTLVRLNTERVRELRAKNLVSQQELDQAEAQLKQSNAQFQTRLAAVEDAKVNLNRCEIKAPIDGVVLSRVAEKGKTVSASTSAPTLFVIVNDLTKMQINAAVAEADIGNVELGQLVNFTVDAFPGRQFRGTITQIRNLAKANQNVVTYETLIEVRNEDLKLKPGMTANVSIVAAQKRDTLRVSNSALRTRLPEDLLPKTPPPAPAAAAKSADGKTPGEGTKTVDKGGEAPKPMSEEEKRRAMRELMREASGGAGGRPTPEVIAKAQALAKERNLDIDFSQMGRGRGGDRGERSSAAAAGAPIERTIYKLVSNDPKNPKIEPVKVKLGITDGITTEVLEGLTEGDVLVTAATRPGAPVAQGAAPASNPFSGGGQRGFGGGGGGGGGRRGGF